jgi:hypothetical protein
MNVRHGVSGLNPAWGEAPHRLVRRGGADGTERRTSAPELELLGQSLAARRSAARNNAVLEGNLRRGVRGHGQIRCRAQEPSRLQKSTGDTPVLSTSG